MADNKAPEFPDRVEQLLRAQLRDDQWVRVDHEGKLQRPNGSHADSSDVVPVTPKQQDALRKAFGIEPASPETDDEELSPEVRERIIEIERRGRATRIAKLRADLAATSDAAQRLDLELDLADALAESSASEADALEAKRICEGILALPGEGEDIVAAKAHARWLVSHLANT